EPDGTAGPVVEVPADDILAWTEGRLVYHGAPLAEVVRSLERRFGVRIALADPELGALRLTAEFRQPAAAEVVQLIARSLGLEYRRTPDGFLLSHRPLGRVVPLRWGHRSSRPMEVHRDEAHAAPGSTRCVARGRADRT